MVNNYNEEHPIAWYQTDDRDKSLEEQVGLFITTGGNGDWYIGVSPASNPNATIQAVRLCTSGGASTIAPGLTWAIADAFKAIQASNEKVKYVRTSNHEDEQELKAWRRMFPEFEFDGRFDLRTIEGSAFGELISVGEWKAKLDSLLAEHQCTSILDDDSEFEAYLNRTVRLGESLGRAQFVELKSDIPTQITHLIESAAEYRQGDFTRLNVQLLELLNKVEGMDKHTLYIINDIKNNLVSGNLTWDDRLRELVLGLLIKPTVDDSIPTYPVGTTTSPVEVHVSNIAGLARDNDCEMAIPKPKITVRVSKAIKGLLNYVKK